MHDGSDPLPGARLSPDGTCTFVVWAPRAQRAVLRLVGPIQHEVRMRPAAGGYHAVRVPGIAAGQRYFFRLDNTPDRPDPASCWQPDGVHGPSAVADMAFDWQDEGWRGLMLADMILYELHIGTFTPEGTFDSAIAGLDRLVGVGINALEVMPIAQFPGVRNWGYDGVYPFAVQTTYGGIAGFKRFVDAAHRKGIAVILDVVYNHLGPEGNYFRHFGPYFSEQYRTPWGDPLNFDGPDSDAVRDFFLANARRWQVEFHLDGLRLDAVPFIKDFSANHILAEIADQARALEAQTGRRFHTIGESDLNDVRILRPRSQGGHGLSSQWTDDFHHALHAYLTGERMGYYADHGTLEHVARAYRNAFVLTGQHSLYRKRRYGAPADERPGEQFVFFAQNHDQVGNRPRGDRLSVLVDDATLRLVAGLLLTAPYVPMLFMGEEYGETAPFPFFVSHGDAGLIERVRQGRKHEADHFGFSGEQFDPGAEATFRRSRLDVTRSHTGAGQALQQWHRELIRLRRGILALARLDRTRTDVTCREEEQLLLVRRWSEEDQVTLDFHFGKEAALREVCFPPGTWRLRLDSALAEATPAAVEGGAVRLRLPGRAMLAYHKASQDA